MSKKRAFFAILVLAILGIILIPFLCCAESGNGSSKLSQVLADTVWVKKVAEDSVVSYAWQKCVIRVFPDRRKIQITCFDVREGDLFQQTIMIWRDRENKVRIRNHRYLIKDSFYTSSYDIFLAKYKEAARRLPLDVQNLFYGSFELGKL